MTLDKMDDRRKGGENIWLAWRAGGCQAHDSTEGKELCTELFRTLPPVSKFEEVAEKNTTKTMRTLR